jgi:hypothetical protein
MPADVEVSRVVLARIIKDRRGHAVGVENVIVSFKLYFDDTRSNLDKELPERP